MPKLTFFEDVEFPPEAQGPKMRALWDDRVRKFAWIMGCGGKRPVDAARLAGYGDPGTHSSSIRVRSHALMQRPEVLDAIEEVGTKVLRGLGPLAIRAARKILHDPRHPEHRKVIEMVMDRTGHGVRSEHKVTVEHVDDGRLRELVARIAVEIGVDAVKLLGRPVIEGEVVNEPQKLSVGNGGGSGGGIGDGG